MVHGFLWDFLLLLFVSFYCLFDKASDIIKITVAWNGSDMSTKITCLDGLISNAVVVFISGACGKWLNQGSLTP